jgi:S-formylglutathione hydrolase FrmB
VTLREATEPLGPPWSRPLHGRFDQLVVESELLAGNPLGDPATRPLYVYLSPRVAAGTAVGVPSVYLLQGYTNQLDTWLARKPFEATFVERLDAMYAAGGCPDAIVVLVDAWTSLGGSQFLNSSATGRYMDYLCDEVVPFIDAVYPTHPHRDRRAVSGHSSGGYGAIVSSMLRPDVFGAFAAHAPDSQFEIFIHDFFEVARLLRDRFDGSYATLLEAARASDPFDWRTFGTAISIYAYAAAYSPDPGSDPAHPGVLLPFELDTGRPIPEIWEMWLAWDPVRMAPHHAAALHGMRRIHLEAGKLDDYFLDLGTQAFAKELRVLGVDHTLELFNGRHGGLQYRYPAAIKTLVEAMTA